MLHPESPRLPAAEARSTNISRYGLWLFHRLAGSQALPDFFLR